MLNTTCNATLDNLRILPTSEVKIVGSLTFHDLSVIIAGATTVFAIILSFFLMFMHAIHYTKPQEQKHIIRILFMVPIYAVASFLSLKYYWHAIYFQVISDCYEAFAISSFFALLCHYVAPDLHQQKEYFRLMRPVKPWVLPVSWFKACCGGERGPWRTPKSGLTWFNIIWIGIYHYCFIRVSMTITAVVTQYFGKYCESSNSPVFSHIWIIVIESVAVSIAMYCVIQFYIQLHQALSDHKPFLKVVAIKLVIFLSFWQSSAISIGTSTLSVLQPNSVLAYPDIKVGIPSLLLCVEMACFSVLHIWAFPYRPYLDNAKVTFYPVPDVASGTPPFENEHGPRQGGFLGIRAFWDAINLWDVAKAFGRGVRWLFVGVRHRHEDVSYQATRKNSGLDMDDLSASSPTGGNGNGNNNINNNNINNNNINNNKNRLDTLDTSYGGMAAAGIIGGGKSTDHLPIATEFRRSQYGEPATLPGAGDHMAASSYDDHRRPYREEHEGLIRHAQPNPSEEPYDASARDDYVIVGEPTVPAAYYEGGSGGHGHVPTALSTVDEESYMSSSRQGSRMDMYASSTAAGSDGMAGDGAYSSGGRNPAARTPTQYAVGQALWGQRGPPGPSGPSGQ